MRALDLVIKLYLVVVALDILLAWVQPEPSRWPRRLTHVLTEPPQVLLRKLIRPSWTGGWDLSSLLLIAILGLVRVAWVQPW